MQLPTNARRLAEICPAALVTLVQLDRPDRDQRGGGDLGVVDAAGNLERALGVRSALAVSAAPHLQAAERGVRHRQLAPVAYRFGECDGFSGGAPGLWLVIGLPGHLRKE